MSIKKSSLEQKWYYRAAKIFFILLPFLVIVIIFLKGSIKISLSGKNIEAVLQQNSVYIFYAVGGLILYFLILKGIWRGFLYITFGGLEDDTKKKSIETTHPVATAPGVSALTPSDKNQIAGWILTLIALGCIYYAYFIYKSPSNPIVPEPKPDQCIPTGCGSNWLCNGSYYSDGVKKSVNGCYSSKTQATTLPSWSGTCRQCP
ncbi:MAG: hypothetical protein V1484_00295 [bacterium]